MRHKAPQLDLLIKKGAKSGIDLSLTQRWSRFKLVVVMLMRGPAKRRILALIGAALLSVAGLEPASGCMSDGQVHFESTDAAASNTASTGCDQGHEDDGAPPENCSGSQHCGSANHSTHAHGPVAVTEIRFEFRVVTSCERYFVPTPLAVDRYIEVGTHPPKV